jgi:hypothetical protein
MMQKFAGACSPEQLSTLQTIFDLIWMEMRASSTSSYSGPADPDALRDEIAKRVLSQSNGNPADPNRIVRDVLASFGIDQPDAWERGNGASRDISSQRGVR